MYCVNAPQRAHNRVTAMRLLVSLGLLVALLAPTAAWAEAEWTDGSPPPLDFSLQVTAAPSTTAPYTWLRSTDSPSIEQSWNEADEVTLSDLVGVTGGVADGMAAATSGRATPLR